ncbi:MAG TPA: N-acetylmuramoyl-L-alanine amidase [Comamonas denitrificans]|nr:N-acetylmuramoyl-L-alanine amidase [Comamonas denitrificans]
MSANRPLVSHPRRRLLQAGTLAFLLGRQQIAFGASVVAVRVWPAPDYSRVTLESDKPLKTTQTFIPNPPRLAVDIQGMQLTNTLKELAVKVQPDDPNIASIRIGQNSPNVVRMVLDLKQAANPQVFTLKPVPPYQHRLVLDLYPAQELDPLAQLIQERLPGSSELAANTTATAAAPAHDDDPLSQLIAQRQTAQTAQAEPAAPATAAPPSAPAQVAAAPAQPAQPAPSTKTAGPTERIIIVALDPGHGGEDPGAIGPRGTREKDIVLKIALLLRQRINATRINGNPMRAFLTRDADFFVPLATRVSKARRVQADLFISIHADAFTKPSANGASVFALSPKGASSAAARWLADKENQADLIGGVNVTSKNKAVQNAVLDMSTTAQIRDSLHLGSAVLSHIGGFAKLHKPKVEQAGFAVLKAPDIPSVLIETAFISNPDEELRLRSPAYQAKLADAIMQGIRQYFAKFPPTARSRSI